jgi:rhodanese-related sulfurtransferase
MQESLSRIRKAVWQVMVIIVVGLTLGISTNAVRHDGLPLLKPAKQDITVFSISDAWTLFRQGKVVFLDARELEAFQSVHLPGAVHVPPEAAMGQADRLKQLAGEGKMLVAYCDGQGCKKAMDLALSLQSIRVPGIGVMPDGWQGWMDSGLPIEEGMK